jgi:hypothetical protein
VVRAVRGWWARASTSAHDGLGRRRRTGEAGQGKLWSRVGVESEAAACQTVTDRSACRESPLSFDSR